MKISIAGREIEEDDEGAEALLKTAQLAYLARYTHRVAISNTRLIALNEAGVTFKWKDYRVKGRRRLCARKWSLFVLSKWIDRFKRVIPSSRRLISPAGGQT